MCVLVTDELQEQFLQDTEDTYRVEEVYRTPLRSCDLRRKSLFINSAKNKNEVPQGLIDKYYPEANEFFCPFKRKLLVNDAIESKYIHIIHTNSSYFSFR